MTDAGLLIGLVGAFPQGHRPEPHVRNASALEAFYKALPEGFGRVPRLYEEFLLSYKWGTGQFGSAELRIGPEPGDQIEFLPNPGGETFDVHIHAVKNDKALWNIIAANGYFQFAQGGRHDYDAVCFALRSRRGDDCPVVGIDHEEILCNNRIRIAMRIAPSFRDLAENARYYRNLRGKVR